MLAVTLVRDSLPNVRRFVESNLAAGMDHLVIAMDAPDPEIERYLATQSQVTVFVADETWWGGVSRRGPQRTPARRRESCS